MKSRNLGRLLPALLVCCCLEALGSPAQVRVGGTGSGTLLLQHMAEAYSKTQTATQVKAVMPPLGSSGGLRALNAAAIDLAVVAMPPNQDELPVGSSVLWVRTPLALVARKSPAPDGLTRDQVADIFSSRLGQWPDGQPIRLVLRSPRESDLKLLRAISPEINQAVGQALKRTGIPVAENDADNQQLLERTPGSFGIMPLGQLMLADSELTPLRIDGVMPSVAMLRNRAYPYEKPLYLVVGKNPSAATQEFLTYLQSRAAQEILAHFGFIPPHW